MEVSGVLQIALDYVAYARIGWDLVQLEPAHLKIIWITTKSNGFFRGPCVTFHRTLWKLVKQLLRKSAKKPTNKQTNKLKNFNKNITSLAVIIKQINITHTGGSGDADTDVGQRTDDEDRHDDDEDKRHVLAVTRPTTGRGGGRCGHDLMTTTRGVQRADQEHVEHEQRHQRTDRPKHQVAGDLVDDEVEPVVSQQRFFHFGVTLHTPFWPSRNTLLPTTCYDTALNETIWA